MLCTFSTLLPCGLHSNWGQSNVINVSLEIIYWLINCNTFLLYNILFHNKTKEYSYLSILTLSITRATISGYLPEAETGF